MSRLGLPRPPRRDGDRGETTSGIVIVIDGRSIGSLDKLAALARDGRLSEWTRAEWTATSSADQ
jgi:hypothetical protein